jgi:mannose-6-phosphate isomerase-like protein (cupin superfamily)
MTDPSSQPIVIRPGEARTIDLGTFQMLVKTTSENTADAFSLLEADEPPGFGPPLHIHHNAAEAFYVLQGEYIIFNGADEIPWRAGSFIFIPAGITHGFRVGAEPGRKLNLYAPGRHGALLRRPERRTCHRPDRPADGDTVRVELAIRS